MKNYENCEVPVFPEITPEEKKLCEVFRNYWLARDSDGELYLYNEEPRRYFGCWDVVGDSGGSLKITPEKVKARFDFITWKTGAYNTSGILRLAGADKE